MAGCIHPHHIVLCNLLVTGEEVSPVMSPANTGGLMGITTELIGGSLMIRDHRLIIVR